jgi:hypothetical protein
MSNPRSQCSVVYSVVTEVGLVSAVMSDYTERKCAILVFRHETGTTYVGVTRQQTGERIYIVFWPRVCACVRARAFSLSDHRVCCEGCSAVMSHILCESHVPTILRRLRLRILCPGIVIGWLSVKWGSTPDAPNVGRIQFWAHLLLTES